MPILPRSVMFSLCTGWILVCVAIVHHSSAQQLNTITCQGVGENGIEDYYACTSEPIHLLQPNAFTLTLEPEGATCGTPRSPFCTLGIRVCSYCDDNDANLMHPVENLYDRNTDNTAPDNTAPDNTAPAPLDTWWQSWTWAMGNSSGTAAYPTPLEVALTLSFNKTYELSEDIVLTFQGGRPQEMKIEKSLDYGVTWELMQVYALSCAPYFEQMDLATSFTADNPVAVTCTQDYSQETPYVNGQVIFSATDRFALYLGPNMNDWEALYTAYERYPLQEFLQFTDLRFTLLHPATDGLEITRQEENLMRYYYAIADIALVGGCFCNLHGRTCVEEDGRKVCNCEHNTEGVNCERCLPLFNNRPWQPGMYLPTGTGTANECQRCECNDHADSCIYDDDEQTGVCIDCQHNTQGIHCQECTAGFYHNDSLTINHLEACVPCECEPLGVADNNTDCSSPEGQCNCRDNIEGLMCEICADSFYGLLQVEPLGTCKDCDCNLDGTLGLSNICEKQLGQCPCKDHITGRQCDLCLPGYYNFPTGEPQRDCYDCGCNPGGSNSTVCNPSSGQCSCMAGIQGTQCSNTQPGYYIPALDAYTYQPIAGTCTQDTDMYSDDNPFTGIAFYRCIESQQVTFEEINGASMERMELQWAAYPALRYSLEGDQEWASVQIQIQVSGESNVDLSTYEASHNMTVEDPSCREVDPGLLQAVNLTAGIGLSWVPEFNITMDIRCRYSVSLTVGTPGQATGSILIDSLVLIPDIETSTIYQNADGSTRSTFRDCVTNTLNLATSRQAIHAVSCQQLTFAVMGDLHSGALPCECDPVGTDSSSLDTCASIGGQCACETGVFQRQCTQCSPGYYSFTATGCTRCNCAPLGSQNLVCDYDSGQCPCYPNVALVGEINTVGEIANLRCQGCLQDHFGYSEGGGCEPCLCNDIGSNATQCADNGLCSCNPTYGGSRCSICQAGYYAFDASGCTLCNCDVDGSLGAECDATSGQCACKTNVESMFCDVCSQGYFNLQASNPDGCQPCFCYGHSAGCLSAQGYVSRIITADTNSLSSWDVLTPAIAEDTQYMVAYIAASTEFLGNQVFSYGQFLFVEIELINSVTFDLRDIMPVVIEGNGVQMFYSCPNDTDPLYHGTPTTMAYMFHEDFWYINATHHPSAYDLQVLLQNLEGLYINVQVGSVTFRALSVQMNSVEEGSSNEPTAYVEDCSCVAEDHVDGQFCEICSQGFYRLSGSPYDTCQACDCSDNSATEPTPVCEELTGVCLNCRDGTTGDHCEACSAHVIAPDCLECEDEFWNISQSGCEPCDCDPVGSSSMICDKVSGQCTCLDEAGGTITGRQCNECIDNYYNLQESGCIECDSVDDTCYTLVYDEVMVLRDMRDNLTAYVTFLMENDNNTVIGSFSSRLNTMLQSMQNLLIFLMGAQDAEESVGRDIVRLNTSLQELFLTQDVDIGHAIYVANNSILSADAVLLTGQAVLSNVQATAIGASDVLTGGIDGALSSMASLVNSLEQVEGELNLIGGSAADDAVDLLGEVQAIEDIARQASTMGQDAVSYILAVNGESDTFPFTKPATRREKKGRNTARTGYDVAQAAQGVYEATHDELTTQTAEVASTQSAVTDLATEADYATGNASEVLSIVQEIESNVASMQSLDVDPVAMVEQAGLYMQQASQLQSESTSATDANSGVTSDVAVVLFNTSSVMAEVETVNTDGTALLQRTTAAHTQAMVAQDTEAQTFTDAQNMLEIMQNFDTLNQEVDTAASSALQQVESVQVLSEAASANAASIQQSLEPAHTASQSAADVARNTEIGSNVILTEMVNVTAQASALSNEAAPLLNGLQTNVGNIIMANLTQVVPAYETCQMLADSVNNLETESNDAVAAAETSLATVEETQSRIAAVISSLSDIRQLDVNAIDALRTEVAALQDAFDQSQLAEAITILKEQKDMQREEIGQLQQQRQILSAQVQRLTTLRDQLQVAGTA